MLDYENAINILAPEDSELEKIAKELNPEIDAVLRRIWDDLPMDKIPISMPEKLIMSVTEHVKKNPEFEDENDFLEKMVIEQLKIK